MMLNKSTSGNGDPEKDDLIEPCPFTILPWEKSSPRLIGPR
jgi:hypothetical protein